jgi:branched-chain amino acid transport system permease protein
MNYVFHLIIYSSVFAIAAIGLHYLVNVAGEVSLAHGACFGFGSYAYAISTTYHGAAPALGIVTAIALAASLGALFSTVATRAWGDALTVCTLAFQVSVHRLFENLYSPEFAPGSLRNLTNGPAGISEIPPLLNASAQASAIEAALAGIGAMLAVVAVLSAMLARTAWVRALVAVREDHRGFRMIGHDERPFRRDAWILSSAFAGLAGAGFASYSGYIDPSVGGLDQSIMLLVMATLLGGSRWWLAMIGAMLMVLLPEALRMISLQESTVSQVRQMLYGAALVLVVHVRVKLGRMRC